MRDIEFRAEKRYFGDRVDLLVCHPERGGDGGLVSYAAPVLFDMRPYDDCAQILEPTLELSKSAAQSLIDALWKCGVRPTGVDTSDAEKRAIVKHLDDMRAITFNKLEIQKP